MSDSERVAGFYWVKRGDRAPVVAEWEVYVSVHGPETKVPGRPAWWNFPGDLSTEVQPEPVVVLSERLDFAQRELLLETQLCELLEHLEEEAAEIIHACKKIKRFGIGGTDPRVKDGMANHVALAYELGQFILIWDAINGLRMPLLRNDDVQAGRVSKFEKLCRYLKHSTLVIDENGELRTVRKEKP